MEAIGPTSVNKSNVWNFHYTCNFYPTSFSHSALKTKSIVDAVLRLAHNASYVWNGLNIGLRQWLVQSLTCHMRVTPYSRWGGNKTCTKCVNLQALLLAQVKTQWKMTFEGGDEALRYSFFTRSFSQYCTMHIYHKIVARHTRKFLSTSLSYRHGIMT